MLKLFGSLFSKKTTTAGDFTLPDDVEIELMHDEADVDTQFVEAAGVSIDDDEHEWRKLTGDSNRDLSALTHARSMELAFHLWQTNGLANRLIELPLAYMLAGGVTITADDETIQNYISDFWNDPINAMDLKLIKKARELGLFGCQCWPTYVNEMNGHVRLGYLDPGLIEKVVFDPDNSEQPIGVVTKKNKKGFRKRYRVIVNGAEESVFTKSTQATRTQFTDGDCFYYKINDLSNSEKGYTDLLANIDWLDAYDQFMFGELDRAAHMRAFFWDVTLKNTNEDGVKAWAKENGSAPAPGSQRIHNDSVEYQAVTPDLKAQDSSENARLFRNHILGGASIPEHWFGGGGDVNRSTGESMGEPTFKMMEMRQTYLGYILKEVLSYVIRQKELAYSNGREPDLNDPIYKFSVQWPEMIARDISKYAAALQQVTAAVAMAISNEVMSHETGLQIIEKITERLGVEFDVTEELKTVLAALNKKKEADSFKDPPDDEGGDKKGTEKEGAA